MEIIFVGILFLICFFIFNATDKTKNLLNKIKFHNQSEIEKFEKKYRDFKINTLGNDYAEIDSYFQYINDEGEKVLALTSSTKLGSNGEFSVYSHEKWLVKQGYVFFVRKFGENGILILENLLD